MFIWSLKRKSHPDIYMNKYKVRLCYYGGQQELCINYQNNYTLVVSWTSIRTIMILSKVYKLNSQSIDFTLAYLQTLIKNNIYFFPSVGIKMNFHGKDCVLKLKKNIYGLKDTGRTWCENCSEGLHNIGFVPSKVN